MIKSIQSETNLRELFPEQSEMVIRKQLICLDKYCKHFIALSPFVCLATSDSQGNVDVSPRGDAPGFVRVRDDKTLVLPDRRGNNRLDSLANVVANGHVGLLFLVPGIDETLRVNGTAEISDDPTLLADHVVRGKTPIVALVVHVEEAFLHCAKAMIRSKLWAPKSQVERGVLPGLGQMVAEQIAGRELSDEDAAGADAV
ncbi:MAG: pyridoxamine 5'-phosphate oxidase family protein, partial [Alphaproteobacteria bacterium]|nr:pyridoxamine 5'-phosphate oxidase family protein [Alphaproteobacteria bacterium]